MVCNPTLWNDYCQMQQMIASNICTSCYGYGDHGYEEEAGCQLVCYRCYGTGKEDPEVMQ